MLHFATVAVMLELGDWKFDCFSDSAIPKTKTITQIDAALSVKLGK
jgi:hypothetical protein